MTISKYCLWVEEEMISPLKQTSPIGFEVQWDFSSHCRNIVITFRGFGFIGSSPNVDWWKDIVRYFSCFLIVKSSEDVLTAILNGVFYLSSIREEFCCLSLISRITSLLRDQPLPWWPCPQPLPCVTPQAPLCWCQNTSLSQAAKGNTQLKKNTGSRKRWRKINFLASSCQKFEFY